MAMEPGEYCVYFSFNVPVNEGSSFGNTTFVYTIKKRMSRLELTETIRKKCGELIREMMQETGSIHLVRPDIRLSGCVGALTIEPN